MKKLSVSGQARKFSLSLVVCLLEINLIIAWLFVAPAPRICLLHWGYCSHILQLLGLHWGCQQSAVVASSCGAHSWWVCTVVPTLGGCVLVATLLFPNERATSEEGAKNL